MGHLPDQIVADLELDVQLRLRRTASFSPVVRSGRHTGLLVERRPSEVTAESFRQLTGDDREYDAWQALQARLDEFARAVAPTLLEPLRPGRAMQRLVDPDTWRWLVEEPIGVGIEKQLTDEVVRGLVASDALVGTFVDSSWVLGNVAPWVLRVLLGENPGPRPEGSQVKVDMVLDRLPRLRAEVSSPTAFAGTTHFAQGYDELLRTFHEATRGELPRAAPGELYCAGLTDPSMMGTLSMEGHHAFSYLAVQTPARLFSDDLVERPWRRGGARRCGLGHRRAQRRDGGARVRPRQLLSTW